MCSCVKLHNPTLVRLSSGNSFAAKLRSLDARSFGQFGFQESVNETTMALPLIAVGQA